MTRLAYLALGIFAGVVITLSLRREPTTARAPILGPVEMGSLVSFKWAGNPGWSWGRVVSIGGTSRDPGYYTVGVERLGPDLIAEDDWATDPYPAGLVS